MARSITLNYVPPLVPAVACVESMQLSEINLTVWCTLAAERFAFASYTVDTVHLVIRLNKLKNNLKNRFMKVSTLSPGMLLFNTINA